MNKIAIDVTLSKKEQRAIEKLLDNKAEVAEHAQLIVVCKKKEGTE